MSQQHIVITGTGRSGTTFLMRLLTMLGLDTGYQAETMNKAIFKRCNSGLEKSRLAHRYVKQMNFYNRLPSMKRQLECVWVPVRDVDQAAESRARHGYGAGGFWGAGNLQAQKEHNVKVLGRIVNDCVTHQIPFKLIDFVRMTNDCDYLYTTLAIEGVDQETFRQAYDQASELSRPGQPSQGQL